MRQGGESVKESATLTNLRVSIVEVALSTMSILLRLAIPRDVVRNIGDC